MAANWRSSLAGPIPNHPMYEDNASYLAARRPQPRVRAEGAVNAELHRGCMDLLFKMQALSTGGSVLDKPRYRKAPKSKDTTSSSSDGESNASLEQRACRARPQTPGQRLSTHRTSHLSVRPSGPAPSGPPQPPSAAIATLDSDVRLIRAELESLRQKLHTNFDSGQRPALGRRTRPEVFDSESQIPPDWVERTRRRREVEEEITYRRSNGDTYRWSNRSPERQGVRFADPPPSLRAREEEIAALKAREQALEEQRQKEEEELALLKAQRKELQREERKRKKEAKKKEEKEKEEKEKEDPDQPEGYRRVPDEERRAMLDLMLQAEAEVRQRIGRLPVVLATLRARQQKETLEEALDELQGAIAVYAQRKVYIKQES